MRAPGHALLAVLVLAAPALAGCLGGSSPTPKAGEGTDARLDGTEATGYPELPTFSDPVVLTREAPGSEPVVDAASDGTLFYQGIGFGYVEEVVRLTNKVWRSTDGGSSWTDVTPPVTGKEATLDAFLHVGPDDTVYVANAAGGTLSLWRSDDLGETWIPLPVPQPPTPIHRMWIQTEADGTLHVAAAGLVYNEPTTGLYYMRSEDAGVTWTPPENVDPEYTLGSPLVVQDGSLYFVSLRRGTDGEWKLVRSPDGGDTWEDRPMWSVETQLESSWQSLVADENGTLYFTWAEMRNDTGRVLYRASNDRGETWSDEHQIAGLRDGSQTMPWASSHEAGILDLVWYAAEETGAPAETSTGWYAHMARVDGADGTTPRMNITRLTPDPVHEGPLCNDGPGCSEGRELADYPWIDHGADGAVHTAFASTVERPDPPSIDYPVVDHGVPLYVGAPASG